MRIRPTLAAVLAVLATATAATAHASAVPERLPPEPEPPASCASPITGFFATYSGRLLGLDTILTCVTGEVDVSYHGDRATGCAPLGSCDQSGTVDWRPDGQGSIEIATVRLRGRVRQLATIGLGDADPLHASTTTALPGAAPVSCEDTTGRFSDPGLLDTPIDRGRLTIAFAHDVEGLLPTRCPGPLDTDLAAALPSAAPSLRQVRQGGTTIDLSGTRSFAAHGYAGTVTSTLAIQEGRPSHSGPERVPRRDRLQLAIATYRVRAVRGRVRVAVGVGAHAPGCAALGACGARGTLALSPGPPRGMLQLIATARGHRPRADLLAALGASRTGNPRGVRIVAAGAVEAGRAGSSTSTVGGRLTERIAGPAGSCRDGVSGAGLAFEGASRRGTLALGFTPAALRIADALRTRCIGPRVGRHPLAVATLHIRDLRGPTLSLVPRGVPFADGPYRVRPHSTLTIVLRRVAVHVSTLPSSRTGG